MRAAIYGAGAMGTVLGAFIIKGGGQIDFITRNAAHVGALNARGAHIVGTVDFTVPVKAYLPSEMSGKYDIIFLMTKQSSNEQICAFLADYLADDGVICTLQNGLPEPSVAQVVGAERCLGCAVSWGATLVGEGVSRLTSSPEKMTFSLGSLEGDHPKLQQIKNFLSMAGEVTVERNFIGARWAKLAVNSAFSSLSALTGFTFGEVARDKKAKRIALDLLNEAFAVAQSCGVTLEKIQGHDIVKIYSCRGGLKRRVALWLLPAAMKYHENIRSGMYDDLIAGNKSDIDRINGLVVRAGRKFGVPTPVNDRVLNVVYAIGRGERTICRENLDLFE